MDDEESDLVKAPQDGAVEFHPLLAHIDEMALNHEEQSKEEEKAKREPGDQKKEIEIEIPGGVPIQEIIKKARSHNGQNHIDDE